jgi:mRNA-degrading endonuclease RelE of RelBE toxin-antitoxin system
MKQIAVLPSFERTFKRLSDRDRKEARESLERFSGFVASGHVPHGFGFKKVGTGIYEFRVNIRVRVIVKDEDNTYYLVIVGNHDDIRRFLRSV